MIAAFAFLAASVVPCHAFLDYLFGGSQTRNAIDNSALGDLRAWWTGNPAYQFNPFYSGSANPGQAASGMTGARNMQGSFSPMGTQPQGNYQPQPQPNVTYFPPQGQQQYGYGPAQGQYPAQAQYQGQPIYGAAGASLPYQGPPQTYQQPQQYQQAPQQQYQYQPQPQAYQQPAPQSYQYQAGYPNR